MEPVVCPRKSIAFAAKYDEFCSAVKGLYRRGLATLVIAPRRLLPVVLLALGVILLVVAGVAYSVTGGGVMGHWILGTATVCCIGAFALAFQR